MQNESNPTGSETFKQLAILLSVLLIVGCSQEAKMNADYTAVEVLSCAQHVRDTHLPSITDIETAKAAAIEIEKTTTKIDSTIATMELAESGKAVVRETIAGIDEEIAEKHREACKIPGVEAVISSAMTELYRSLEKI